MCVPRARHGEPLRPIRRVASVKGEVKRDTHLMGVKRDTHLMVKRDTHLIGHATVKRDTHLIGHADNFS